MTAKTTDKELLELAAKAAGIDYDPDKSTPHPVSGAFWGLWLLIKGEPYEGQRRYWNPLVDDGDALRLVFKLGLRVCIDNRAGVSWIKRFEDSTAHGDDAASATRRAIVRAAAEIGKTMP